MGENTKERNIISELIQRRQIREGTTEKGKGRPKKDKAVQEGELVYFEEV